MLGCDTIANYIAFTFMPSSAKPRALDLTLYGGKDPRDLPRYTFVDAARAIEVPASTIGMWVRGQDYPLKGRMGRFHPVLCRPDPRDTRLSFNNLLEAFVLRALRRVHDVSMKTVRQAVANAEQQHGIPRLLISNQLRTSGGDLFLDSYFQLVDLSNAAQIAMRSILRDYLQRVRFEDAPVHVEFFPLPRHPSNRDRQLILVSPYIAFGSPVVRRTGVTTLAIAARVNLGESAEAVMEDYGLEESEFYEAIAYEQYAA